jgi:hypothetical protein
VGLAWLAAILISQTGTIQGTILPPVAEKTVIFTDRGRTYRVGTDSARVAFTDDQASPLPQLEGFARQVFEAFQGAVITDRKRTAEDLHHQIDVTLAKAGGLSLDAPSIIADLADGITRAGLSSRLTGFRLGDLIKAQGDDRESILRSLRAVQQALRAVK